MELIELECLPLFSPTTTRFIELAGEINTIIGPLSFVVFLMWELIGQIMESEPDFRGNFELSMGSLEL
jgi:hypothetical protein